MDIGMDMEMGPDEEMNSPSQLAARTLAADE